MSKTYRLALVGFGSVGRGLAQILRDRGAWIGTHYNAQLSIVAVNTRRSGTVANQSGFDLAALLRAAEEDQLAQAGTTIAGGPLELLEQVEADVLVEASATDLTTGEPATSYVRAAIARGMHVVTANKGPVALHGRELARLAHARGVGFGYEGTVMSGTPALRLGWGALAGCELREVRGIINGTTNYILTQMEGGLPYADALADAQRLGYAETDPTGDVEGYDAAGKAVILANMLLGGDVRLEDVDRTGITQITPEDVAAARAAGERWKLVARVARVGDAIVASVKPTRLPATHPLASVGGALNALTFDTDLLGEVTVIGPGAGGVATGFALLSDILALP